MRHPRIHLLILAVLTALPYAWGQDAIRIEPVDQTHWRLVHERLAIEIICEPPVRHITFETPDAEEAHGVRYETLEKPTANIQPRFGTRGIIPGVDWKYDWGQVSIQLIRLNDNLLWIIVTVHNESDRTVAAIELNPLVVEFDSRPTGWDASKARLGYSLDDLWQLTVPLNEHRLDISHMSGTPLRLGLGRSTDDDGKRYPLVMAGGVMTPTPEGHPIPPYGYPRIPTGESFGSLFVVTVRSREADRQDINEGFPASWTETHVQDPLAWPDRRPIGMLMLSSSAAMHKSETNPRGWFNDPKIDVTTPEGRAAFEKRAIAYAERSARELNRVGAQGFIAWDLEGQENKHPISYIGDPRMLGTFAPEMDAVADRFMATLRDAGLRVGVCIRPSQVRYDEEKQTWSHGTGSAENSKPMGDENGVPARDDRWRIFPVVDRLDAKIRYAKERWQAEIFYVDTNVLWLPHGEEPTFDGYLIPAWVWQELNRRHPDVLIIPELWRGRQGFHTLQWAWTAPYMELDLKGYGTRDRVRDLVPGAFSIVNISDGPIEEQHDTLVQSVRRGDILLFRGWFGDKRNDRVIQIYADAATDQADGQ